MPTYGLDYVVKARCVSFVTDDCLFMGQVYKWKIMYDVQ